MSDFSKCITKTLQYEGVSSTSTGYVDHPLDKGGATNFGISLSFVKDTGDIETFDTNGDMILDKTDIKNMTFEQAVKAYKKYFWDYYDLDSIEDNKKCFLIFDSAVNHGLKGATRLVQKTLSELGYPIKVDGIYGPKTKSALIECPVDDFIRVFQEKRTALYNAIVKNNPKQKVFLKGWLNRIDQTTKDLQYV